MLGGGVSQGWARKSSTASRARDRDVQAKPKGEEGRSLATTVAEEGEGAPSPAPPLTSSRQGAEHSPAPSRCNRRRGVG